MLILHDFRQCNVKIVLKLDFLLYLLGKCTGMISNSPYIFCRMISIRHKVTRLYYFY